MFVQWSVVLLTGIYIVYMDLKYRRIPNGVNLFIAIVGLVYTLYMQVYGPHFMAVLVLGGGLLAFGTMTQGFGMGDVKYMMATGLLLGIKVASNGLLIGLVLGAGYGVYLLCIKKAKGKDTFAYGPFLVVGHLSALALEHDILGFIFKIG